MCAYILLNVLFHMVTMMECEVVASRVMWFLLRGERGIPFKKLRCQCPKHIETNSKLQRNRTMSSGAGDGHINHGPDSVTECV